MYFKNKKIFSIKGMHDILPKDDIYIWEYIEYTIKNILNSYGFEKIITPIVESTNLYQKTLDKKKDNLFKEMYTFKDKLNEDYLTLRPENTSSIARSCVEHNLIYNGPKRFWYSGSMFRHEKPQNGRYRQFHQIGAEAIGYIGPDIDAEIIMICYRIWKKFKLNNIILELNSIGEKKDRENYNNDLINFFKKYEYMLNTNDLKKFYLNPISIFDIKNSQIIDTFEKAPKLYNYLNNNSIYHLEEIKKILFYNKIPFIINYYLVRGINYYNKTVFEWKNKNNFYSQNTLCGGGRYDHLIKKLGGKKTPACGFAIGFERLFETIKKNIFFKKKKYDVYLINYGKNAKLKSFLLSEILRNIGIKTILHCETKKNMSNIKSQLKKANKIGVKFSIIIGENEIKTNTIIIKTMKNINNFKKQIKIPFSQVTNFFLKKNNFN